MSFLPPPRGAEHCLLAFLLLPPEKWVRMLFCCPCKIAAGALLFRFTRPTGGSRLSHRFATIKALLSLAHGHHYIILSTLFCHRSLPFPRPAGPPSLLNPARVIRRSHMIPTRNPTSQ